MSVEQATAPSPELAEPVFQPLIQLALLGEGKRANVDQD